MEYDDNENIIYLGRHREPKANEDDDGWYIEKFIYDANDNPITARGPELGAWNKRGSLF
jgi:hypothetical protein